MRLACFLENGQGRPLSLVKDFWKLGWPLPQSWGCPPAPCVWASAQHRPMPQQPSASHACSSWPGAHVLSASCLSPWLLSRGYLECQLCALKAVVVSPRKSVSHLSTHPQAPLVFGTFCNCHVASCLRCPFLFVERTAAASWGSHIFPVSRILFPDRMDEGKCLPCEGSLSQPVQFGAQASELTECSASHCVFPWLLLGCREC